MVCLTENYQDNVALLDSLLRVKDNFDVLKKPITVGEDEVTLYYIDGFVKDAVMSKLMTYFVSLKTLGKGCGETVAKAFLDAHVPYVETELCQKTDSLIQLILSGATVMLGSRFGACAIVIDARTYPARETAEPQNDRVMLGSRDGFVETLIFNTALIRRRIRDTALTMRYMAVGDKSRTDVVMCYMSDRADMKYVERLAARLSAIRTEALPMGHQSLSECLIRTRWYNPFPKIRTTERPDAAAAQLLEGSVLLIVDNSPEVMILPTGILDFIQETNDYYFPPLTGSFLRVVRLVIMWLTMFLTPTWYLLVKNPSLVPDFLAFTIPENGGKIPILAQLLITEFVIDGLRMASMNTPDMLSNSLSVVGGLILGDFAIGIGWLIPEVILYMAFVSIANFSQRNYELGYAFKFLRILMLILTATLGPAGYIAGAVVSMLLIITNKTVDGSRSYLYPLIPFNGRAMAALFLRVKKRDVATKKD